MLGWIDGAPPDFSGQDRVWILAEVPARWKAGYAGYKCFYWLVDHWTDKEVYRARRWMRLPLPQDD